MCSQRIVARAASATPVTTGYVTHRRLTFHKRGGDGSAKADAVYTGRAGDRVWGVVFAVHPECKRALDGHEPGYREEEVVVINSDGTHAAVTYVARSEVIAPSLKPFSWYLGFLIHGAEQHQLPSDYRDQLQTFEAVLDPDTDRHHRNSRLIT